MEMAAGNAKHAPPARAIFSAGKAGAGHPRIAGGTSWEFLSGSGAAIFFKRHPDGGYRPGDYAGRSGRLKRIVRKGADGAVWN